MAPGGYHGRVCTVDLGDGSTHVRVLPDALLRATIGGAGLGARLLLDESPAGVDPLAPEAALVVALSPLVGSPLTTSAKFAMVAKSPLTNRICDALASDRFAIELKGAGMDALVVKGRAPSWSLLVVDDGEIRLEPADALVGLSAEDAEAAVTERMGTGFRFFGIGPAGERLVRYATVSGDGRHAGRGGLGGRPGGEAPQGHRRPRHAALRGGRSRRGARPGARPLRALARRGHRQVPRPRHGRQRARHEPPRGPAHAQLPRPGRSRRPRRSRGEAFHALPGRIRKHCAACTIGCEHVFRDKQGRGVRLEYEGVFALGPLCGIGDRDAVLAAAARCDALGLDVISAGGNRSLRHGVPGARTARGRTPLRGRRGAARSAGRHRRTEGAAATCWPRDRRARPPRWGATRRASPAT